MGNHLSFSLKRTVPATSPLGCSYLRLVFFSFSCIVRKAPVNFEIAKMTPLISKTCLPNLLEMQTCVSVYERKHDSSTTSINSVFSIIVRDAEENMQHFHARWCGQ
jgi:hypothetical protein